MNITFHPFASLSTLTAPHTLSPLLKPYSSYVNNMEALLRQSKGVCPFLKKTSPTTLRSLSTSTRQSPGGGTITNLQFVARRCPVMNKALAVRSAQNSARNYGKVATGSTGTVKSLLEKKLHTSAEKKASVDGNVLPRAHPGIGIYQLGGVTY